MVASASQGLHVVLAALGFTSLLLLWLAVAAGFVLRNSWIQTRIRRTTVYGVHQIVTLVSLCLGVFHGLAQLIVPGGTITLLDLIVPFADSEDPIGIGAGVAGLELVIAVTLSTLIQHRLGLARWRALHSLGYAAFTLIVAHMLISGSDVATPWVWMLALGAWSVTFVLWLRTLSFMDGLGRRVASYRLSIRRPELDRPRDVQVRVDVLHCMRFGFCEHVAPDLFQLRADGQLWYQTTVPSERAYAVAHAIQVCPTRAIAFGDQRMSPPAPQLDPAPDSARQYGRPRAIPGLRRETPSAKGEPWDSPAGRRTTGS